MVPVVFTFSSLSHVLTFLLTFINIYEPDCFPNRWGTTRECWIYYTNQTPPIFAVFAHGMAAVAFWRTGVLVEKVWGRVNTKFARLKAMNL